MKKHLRAIFSAAISLAMISSAASSLSVYAEDNNTYTPIFEGDTVINEWKFDFGSGENVKDGYTSVTPDRNVITSKDYGFIGNDGNGYLVSPRYDSFAYQEGQTMNLVAGGTEENDAIGIEAQGDPQSQQRDYTTGEYYPVSFGMYVEPGSYYRVRATVTTLDPEKPAKASLYYERRHPVFNQKTIDAGQTYTVEFSVDVENIYFEKSDPKGVFTDDMLNISLLGENAALESLDIQQIDESKGTATTLWVLGDSTVTDGDASVPYFDLQNYTGVGAYLSKYVPANVAVSNHGEGGLNANDNNHFNMVKDNIKKGDYLYVEYGHNHKNNSTQSYSGEYWLHNYLSCLPKYYDACEAVGATLIVVGPFDRHNTSQYDSETNTWSSTLGSFSDIGMKYVDCMLYGGKDTANSFIAKWAEIANAAEAKQDTTELKAEADAIWSTAKAGEPNGVTNIGFVDLNAPSLTWLSSVTASGTILGVEYTNYQPLSNFYFTTPRAGGTDGTHTNDAGADAMAYNFFSTADSEAYPALKPLLANFEEGAEHQNAVPVSAEVINEGCPSLIYWPYYQKLIEYDYAAYIKSVKFNDDGTPASVDIQVQDNTMMSSYSSALLAVYDKETGILKSTIRSSDHVDNTNSGLVTLGFDTDVVVGDNDTYKVFLWSYDDDPENGNPLTMVPYAAAYEKTDVIANMFSGESNDEMEDFTYYGKTYDGTESINGLNGWTFGGSAGNELTLNKDNDYNYLSVKSDGAKNGAAGQGSFYLMRTMDAATTSSGKYEISGDFKYVSGGGVNIALSNGYLNKSPFIEAGKEFIAFTIGSDGAVTIGGEEVGRVSASSWTNIKYTLNMDTGKASISIAGGTPVEVDVAEYMTMTAPANDKLDSFIIEGQKVAFEFDVTNLQVRQLDNTDIPDKTVNLAVNADTDASGSVMIDDEAVESKTVPQSTNVKIKAVPGEGSIFLGWEDANGDIVSSDAELTYRLFDDLSLTAKFAKASSVDDIVSFDIESTKGLVKLGGTMPVLSPVNAVDASGYPVEVASTDIKWLCDTEGVTIDENGQVSIDDTFALDKNNTADIVIKGAVGNTEASYTLTVYTYAFYENLKDGKASTGWDGIVADIAGKDAMVFPGGNGTYTLTLDDPAVLSGTQTISYSTGAGGDKLCGQPRYIEIYDTNGNRVVNDVIGYSWGSLFVGGTIGKDSISGASKEYVEVATIGSWTDTVTITLNKDDNTGTVTYKGESVDITLNENASDIAKIVLKSEAGAPDYTARALAITDLVITDSDTIDIGGGSIGGWEDGGTVEGEIIF